MHALRNFRREVGRQFFPGHPLGEIQQHIILQKFYCLHRGGLFAFLRIQVDEGVSLLIVHAPGDGGGLPHHANQPQEDILGLAQGSLGHPALPEVCHLVQSLQQLLQGLHVPIPHRGQDHVLHPESLVAALLIGTAHGQPGFYSLRLGGSGNLSGDPGALWGNASVQGEIQAPQQIGELVIGIPGHPGQQPVEHRPIPVANAVLPGKDGDHLLRYRLAEYRAQQ